ncbi:MAG: 50S ribosomal protein L19 [Nitrospinaceae bacterium]|jgi:large subunit ribosomal protein L19|nr:50S ribosomal protein L19 [Nitrospinaceae bacterium]MDP6657652.1 50S ribosomal protein L19 [Nitrospinaceae bacterium]MDP6712422.1 50S ribosomal protein L19 [Nitrospinaceae bacterium]MDP7058160.1 50S ribosomal protein L19 [Nitrospinaceae bacterium]HAK37493.1 50S ribosomal protein L19 [Nitrospina sp.]|tara:strand:+ start:1214 stop:1615 length:402 start_codon:yes stop_codon:yes gene_type:complete
MNLIDRIEAGELKKERSPVRVGDTVRAHIRIVEGEKERVQVFEGVVIRLHGGGARESITIRKVSFGVGVERIFPLNSPRLEKVEIIRHAKVRQAKLYFLRELRGKAARLKELKPKLDPTKKKKTRKKAARKKA